MASELWNIPNGLSMSRLPLAAGLCTFIAMEAWLAALFVFLLAALTDLLDGWWARRYGPMTTIGRSLDPLTDKVLIGSVLIFLIPVNASLIAPWMVAVIAARELLITGLRGVAEAEGSKFGADNFGKAKTVLQFTVILLFLLMQIWRSNWPSSRLPGIFENIYSCGIYLMIAATVASGLQYALRALPILAKPHKHDDVDRAK